MGKNLTQLLYEISEKGADIADGGVSLEGAKEITDAGGIMGKASDFAVCVTTSDYFAGRITIREDGLPANVIVNGVRSETLIQEFAENGMKVVGVSTIGADIRAGSAGHTAFYFEGDPKELEQKYNKLMQSAVAEMTSSKNLNGYEQKIIANAKNALSHNAEKANADFSNGPELSENERREIHELVTELSKSGVNYDGSIPDKDLSALSASTGIDPAILQQAATKAKQR